MARRTLSTRRMDGRIHSWTCMTILAVVVDAAAADHLHLMQRRAVLKEESGSAAELQSVRLCSGVDCELPRHANGSHIAQSDAVEQMDDLRVQDVEDEESEDVEGMVGSDVLSHTASAEDRFNMSATTDKQESAQTPTHTYQNVHVDPHNGDEHVRWDLCNASYHSNLGGLGPDDGEESLRFFKVYSYYDSETGSTNYIDLQIETRGEYKASAIEKNGRHFDSCFGQVNVASGDNGTNSVTLHFNWYLAGTNIRAVPKRHFLTIYDVDGTEKSSESVSFFNRVRTVYLSNSTELSQSGDLDSGLTFTAHGLTNNVRMPVDPYNLTEAQQARAVTVCYEQQTQFQLTFSVTGGKGGRNFLFTGHSLLVETGTATGHIGSASHATHYDPGPSDAATPSPTTCEEAGTCSVFEDPHVRVFDGAQISLWGTDHRALEEPGPVWLVQSSDVKIQGYYLPDPELPERLLFVRELAIGGPFLKNNTLILGPLGEEVSWNGERILKAGTSDFMADIGGGLVKARRSTKSHFVQNMSLTHAGVDLFLPLGVNLTVNRYMNHVNVFIQMAPAAGGQEGLCGNFNCNAADDTLKSIMADRSPKVIPGDSLFRHTPISHRV